MLSYINYDFYYGNEAEQFTFYRIPKFLMKDIRFKELPVEAKILYGLLMDRMGLSIRNRWLDENNRVYIIYTFEEIINDMGCSRQKASKLLSELDKSGLIVRKRRGLGKPNIIYVKNIIAVIKAEEKTENEDRSEETEVPDSNLQKFEDHTSVSTECKLQEVLKSNSNDNRYSNTDFNDIEYDTIYPTLSYPENNKANSEKNDRNERYKAYKQIIMNNIEYDALVREYGKAAIDGIAEIMVEIMNGKRQSITIGGGNIPYEAVRSRFMKLKYSHVSYVMDCLKKNKTKIKNIKNYMIASLYNSYTTIDHYYTADANYDLYGAANQ